MHISEIIKNKKQSWKRFLGELILLVLIIFFIRSYVFQIFRVTGPSMCPTLNQFEEKCEQGSGDFVFTNEFLYRFIRAPKRGDVVVFESPNLIESPIKSFLKNKLHFPISSRTKASYVKRIIGIPGDIIKIEAGKVFRKTPEDTAFKELDEAFLSETNNGATYSSKEIFDVPEGKYLMFGDNRTRSLDARHCFGSCSDEKASPFIAKSKITGQVEFVLFPFNRIRAID